MNNQQHSNRNMLFGDVSFSVASHTAWAPGLETAAAWLEWAHDRREMAAPADPKVKDMPAMLRRRASPAGKMALEVAYAGLPPVSARANADAAAPHIDLPVVFASRHGECARSVDLLRELAGDAPLSPAAFSLSVHNANAGLFSIARDDRSSSVAVAAGPSTVEHALIEACGLLADGAPQVLLVVSDVPPPDVFSPYNDCAEQGFAWAWLLQPADIATTASATGAKGATDADIERFSLSWSDAAEVVDTVDVAAKGQACAQSAVSAPAPAGLDVIRFFLRRDAELARVANGRSACSRFVPDLVSDFLVAAAPFAAAHSAFLFFTNIAAKRSCREFRRFSPRQKPATRKYVRNLSLSTICAP